MKNLTMPARVTKQFYPSHQRQRIEWEIYVNSAKKKSTRNLVFFSDFTNTELQPIKKAYTELLRRHESLRTTFSDTEGILHQHIHPMEGPLPELKLFELGNSEDVHKYLPKNLQLDALISKLTRITFDLENGPLISPSLIRLNATDYKFVMVINHIVSDLDSLNILKNELNSLHTSFAKSQPISLGLPRYQLRDFATWESNFFQNHRGRTNLAYWNEVFSKPIQKLELGPKWKKKSLFEFFMKKNSEKSGYEIFLSERDKNSLTKLSQELKVPKICLYFASLYLFYFKLSGQKDISIGTPVSNRSKKMAKNLVGYLTRALYVRTSISENQSLKAFIASISEIYMEALEHRVFPLHDLCIPIDKQCPMVLNYFPESPESKQEERTFRDRYINGDPTPFYRFNFAFREYSSGLLVQYQQQKNETHYSKIPALLKAYKKLLRSMIASPSKTIQELASS